MRRGSQGRMGPVAGAHGGNRSRSTTASSAATSASAASMKPARHRLTPRPRAYHKPGDGRTFAPHALPRASRCPASSIAIDGLTRRNAFHGGCFTSAGRLRVYSGLGQDTVTALPSVSCLRSKAASRALDLAATLVSCRLIFLRS
jgi:hypothetical protein